LSGLDPGATGTEPDGLFEQLLEFTPDAIIGIGRDQRIALVNAQAEALFGYTRAELRGEKPELLVPERFRGLHLGHRDWFFANPRKRPLGEGLVLAGRRKDGTEFPAEVSLSTMETEQGPLAIAAIRDIGERRAAEAFLAAIVDSSDDAIIGKTADGTIVSWNAGAERLYGYRAAEVVGRPVSLLVTPDRFHENDAHLRQVAAGDLVEHHETVRVGKDGRPLAISLRLSPIRDERGRIVGAATIARDISREKAAQKKFEQLLELAPDAIVGIGADGRIVLANAQAEALFGYAHDELLGAVIEQLVPERFRAVHPRHRAEYLAAPVMRPMGAGLALFGRRKDGTEFPAEISLSAIETEDGLHATAAIRDITDRVDAERERDALRAALEEARSLEAAREKEGLETQLNQLRRLESVGQLAGGIAHDFNNILGVILNYAQFVAEGIEEGSPVRQDVEEIRRAGERAAALTRQLLIFSRREVVRPEVLDLNVVVSELDRLLRRVLGEHIELETRFAPGLARVEADPGQLEQVLVNLAVNARDAMPTGGHLLIETANVELGGAPGDGPAAPYVDVTVSDTGVGMTRAVRARVFEPFFTTKPKNEGTGLGLATVYGIVAEAGGTISIDSEPGIGTSVKVRLPATAVAPPPSPAVHPELPRPAGRGETVLVVEDEESMRVLVERILSTAGYDVLAVARGQLALEACERPDQPIDLMMTDVVMPEMQGPELVERATAIRSGLRVLYMSGYVHEAGTQLGASPEDTPFVEKPFTADQLLTRVRQALDDERPASGGGQ
jgi:two-component system cell cycle sensor histidine kinase/response regulator CckA